MESDKKEIVDSFLDFFNDVDNFIAPAKSNKKPEVLNQVGMGTKFSEN